MIEPEHSALLVMDYQVGILSRLGESAAALLERVAEAIAVVRTRVGAFASADPEPEVHEFLMTRIFPRQAEVISVAELPGLLGAR